MTWRVWLSLVVFLFCLYYQIFVYVVDVDVVVTQEHEQHHHGLFNWIQFIGYSCLLAYILWCQRQRQRQGQQRQGQQQQDDNTYANMKLLFALSSLVTTTVPSVGLLMGPGMGPVGSSSLVWPGASMGWSLVWSIGSRIFQLPLLYLLHHIYQQHSLLVKDLLMLKKYAIRDMKQFFRYLPTTTPTHRFLNQLDQMQEDHHPPIPITVAIYLLFSYLIVVYTVLILIRVILYIMMNSTTSLSEFQFMIFYVYFPYVHAYALIQFVTFVLVCALATSRDGHYHHNTMMTMTTTLTSTLACQLINNFSLPEYMLEWFPPAATAANERGQEEEQEEENYKYIRERLFMEELPHHVGQVVIHRKFFTGEKEVEDNNNIRCFICLSYLHQQDKKSKKKSECWVHLSCFPSHAAHQHCLYKWIRLSRGGEEEEEKEVKKERGQFHCPLCNCWIEKIIVGGVGG